MESRLLPDKVLNDHLDNVDYYALLGIPRDASPDAIRDAFHHFALRYHPDQHVEDAAAKLRALRIFKRGSEGYRVLLDPVLRARYDSALKRGELRLTPEAERKTVAAETTVATVAERPLPPDVQPFFDKAREAMTRGDLKNAKAFLLLAARKGPHPRLQALTKEILEAERNALAKR